MDSTGSRVALIASEPVRKASDDLLIELSYYIDGIHEEHHMATPGEIGQLILDADRLSDLMRFDLAGSTDSA